MEREKLIELENVCFAYEGHIALRYVNLDIHRGETVVLEGSNGSGKSTLLRLINGLLFAEEGSYKFEGKEISRVTMKDSKFSKWFHQRLGFVFQNSDVQLFCSNVEEEIAFGPLQMGLTDEQVQQRVNDVIALLDIDKLRERAPYHLSGGEKKKVAIACILSMNPDILVFDEPLAGLDYSSQEWLIDFMLSLKKAGKTMIIATHNQELSEKLADRHIFFNEDHETEELHVVYHSHRHMHVLDASARDEAEIEHEIEHHHHKKEELVTDYKLMCAQMSAFAEEKAGQIALLSNASALINESMNDLNWAGFYLMNKGELILGPFQGKPACIRIQVGRGVCGTAVAEDKTQRVEDVHQFPGHIACDSASNSEIVIPLHKDGEIIGVLDIDSPNLNRFSEEDQKGLEEFAKILEGAL